MRLELVLIVTICIIITISGCVSETEQGNISNRNKTQVPETGDDSNLCGSGYIFDGKDCCNDTDSNGECDPMGDQNAQAQECRNVDGSSCCIVDKCERIWDLCPDAIEKTFIGCDENCHPIMDCKYRDLSANPCGNDPGNGDEIMHGADGPNDYDPDNPFVSLTVHPLDENTILQGTERNGFLKSVDGGTTWERLRKGLRHDEWFGGYPEVYDIAYSESDPSIIYAVTTGGPGPIAGPDGGDGGVYKSNDGGKTWVRKNCGIENEWIFSIYVSPSDPDVAVIGVSGEEASASHGDVEEGTFYYGGIYRTVNGGDNWTKVSIDEDEGINGYVNLKHSESVVYTFGQLPKGGNDGNIGFYRSFDDGATWEPFASELRDTYGAYFDVSGDVIYSADSGSIHKSIDGGETWREYSTSGWVYAIAISPEDTNTVVYSTSGGLYLTTNGMSSKSEVVDIPGENHVTDIVFAPTDSNIVYAIGVGYDIYKSTNSGKSFIKIVNLRTDVLNPE